MSSDLHLRAVGLEVQRLEEARNHLGGSCRHPQQSWPQCTPFGPSWRPDSTSNGLAVWKYVDFLKRGLCDLFQSITGLLVVVA